MNFLMTAALAITLLGGTAAYAQDHSAMDNGQRHDQNIHQVQDNHAQNRGPSHHRRQVCTVRHHHRHCSWS